MPQDGSNNYQYPPGTRGVPDQTIESEAYNTFLDDLVVNDLNIPRPIHRGGTGASTASTAIYNLGGERAGAVVTNYDSHLWMSGSFYSAAGATGAPVPGRAFVGIAYSSDAPADPPANLNVIIEARDQNDTTVPGRVYIREKKAGVWGVWKGEDRLGVQTTPPSTVNSPDGALWWDNDNGVLYVNYNDGNTTQWVQAVALPQIDVSTFVAKAGDTMTGLLTLSGEPTVDLHAATKLYVDAGVGGVGGGLAAKVAKAGDTMTGPLALAIQIPAVKTTNYSIVATDRDAVIRGTGSWTLSHTVTAAGNTGFRYTIKNDGLETITIDPAGSETINGTTTLLCLAKEQFDVVSDGTNWITIGRQAYVLLQTVTAAGASLLDFTVPPDYSSVIIEFGHAGASTAGAIALKFATDGVPNFISTANYFYSTIYAGSGSVAAASQVLGTTAATITRSGFAGTFTASGRCTISPPVYISWSGYSSIQLDGGGNRISEAYGGYLTLGGRATHFRLVPISGGTITGSFSLMGVP